MKHKIFMMFFNLLANKYVINEELDVKRLGSVYGGWHVCCSELNKNTRILSLGAGEDISFDVEVANNYGCLVDIFDPTPQAIQHFKNLKKQYGKGSSRDYTNSGCQDIRSYNLLQVYEKQIKFSAKAVWIRRGKVSFFKPLKKNSVSHTITAYNSEGNQPRESIKVSCVDILDIEIEKYEVLKLDIEGAELPVLKRLIENTKIEQLPKQILVEFDELQIANLVNFKNVFLFSQYLQNSGYQLIKKEKFNFTYCKV